MVQSWLCLSWLCLRWLCLARFQFQFPHSSQTRKIPYLIIWPGVGSSKASSPDIRRLTTSNPNGCSATSICDSTRHRATRTQQGQPAYEAIVFIEWDESSREYKCLWLDSTGGGGLSAPIAQGKRGNDEIAFFLKDKDDKDSGVRTTFAYSKGADTWNWLIDNETGGKRTPFARVKLTRK